MRSRRNSNPVLAGIAAAAVAGGASAQTTWYVDDDACPGPGSGSQGDPFCAIQDAIFEAGGGDVILVSPGTYLENIDFLGKAVTLRSTDGALATTIDGQAADSVVRCTGGEGPETVLDGFTITNGDNNYGGGMYNSSSSPTVVNCTFSANVSGNIGGGMLNLHGSHPKVTNCTFSGNSATSGGAVFNTSGSAPTLAHCTLTGNSATSGGALSSNASSPKVVNSILWGDSPNEISEVSSSTTVVFSDVQGGWAGGGNINADPMFVGLPEATFHLSAGSPCIDAGVSLGLDTDAAGNRREFDDPATPDTGVGCGSPVADMGAFEFGSTPPCPYGGYSNQIVVDEKFVLRLSDKLDLAAAAPLLCAGITTWSPLRMWEAGPGRKVGIVGLGGLGHMGVKFSHAFGAHTVLFTRSAGKTDDAKRLGADEVVISKNEDEMAAHANSFDFILNTVAASHNLDAYIGLLKRDGTMCLVGAPDSPHPSPEVIGLIFKRRRIAGSCIGGIRETQEMLDYCADKGIVCDIELIPMQKINEAYERMLRSDVKYRFVIDMSSLAPQGE